MKWFLRSLRKLLSKLMPAFFQDQLDDPIQFEMSSSFEGGMVSNAKANSLQANQAALLVNCDINRVGEITTRRGTARVGGGSVNSGNPIIRMVRFSTTAGTEQLIASVNNGGSPSRIYYYVDGGAWTLATASIPVTTGYTPIVQGIDKLYMRGSDLHLYSWDGTTAVDLGGGGANQPPLGGPGLAWFTNRLIASDGRDAIAFSDILDATTWAAENSIRVGAGENDVILGLFKWTDFNLIVAKRRSLWVVNCDPTVAPAEFEIKTLHHSVGTLAPQTFVQTEGGDLLGLVRVGSNQEVRSMKRVFAAENSSELGPALSYPIQDLIDRINPAYVSKCCATYWRNRYFLSVPLDSATNPNYTFVYNTLTNSWTGYWTGWTPTAFAERLITADGSTRLVIGSSDGNVYEWLDYVAVASEISSSFQDNGSSIATRLITKAFNFGELVSPKTGMTCEVEYTSAGNLTGQLVADGTNAGSAASLSSGQTRKAFDVQSIGQFRELQLDLNATSGKQTIRNVKVGGFVDTLQLQS